MDIPGYMIESVVLSRESKYIRLPVRALGGGLEAGIRARLFPGGASLFIKSVEKQGGRYMLGIKGAAKTACTAGALILDARWPVEETLEALILPDGGMRPDESEAVCGGPSANFNSKRLIGRASFDSRGAFWRLRFPKPYPLAPGMRVSIPGEDGKPRFFTVLYPGIPSRDMFRRLDSGAKRRPQSAPELKELYGRLLFAGGYQLLPPSILNASWENAEVLGNWAVTRQMQDSLEKAVLKASSVPGGLDADGPIIKGSDVPRELLRTLSETMVSGGKLKKQGHWLMPPGPPRLSPFHRGLLEKVNASREDGLRVSSIAPGQAEAFDVLGRSALIRGGRELWLSREAFDILADRLLLNLGPGDGLSMARARTILGGSRVRTLEMLVELEAEGLLIPGEDGTERTVAG